MENFFAYGTLMCKDIMEEVSGFCPSSVPAILRGYLRRAVKGEYYPAMFPKEGGWVEGLIYRNVPDLAWEELDHFEGEMYSRQFVQVELKGCTTLGAAAYVVKSEFLCHLEPFDWDFTEFMHSGKARFKRQYKGC